MKGQFLKLGVGGLFLALLFTSAWVTRELTEPLEGLSEDQVLQVSAGDSLTKVLARASEEGWLTYPRLVS